MSAITDMADLHVEIVKYSYSTQLERVVTMHLEPTKLSFSIAGKIFVSTKNIAGPLSDELLWEISGETPLHLSIYVIVNEVEKEITFELYPVSRSYWHGH